MTTEHRKSPRRKVVDISRLGGWGDVKYHHKLECGHIEIRPRASKAPTLACVWCLRAEEKDKELRELEEISEFLPTVVDFGGRLSQNEVEVAQLTSELARRFGLPVEAVTVTVRWRDDRPVVQSAVVFLSAEDVARLTRGGNT